MLSSFKFPGKDTRLIRCGSTVYKITIQSNGDSHRFQEEHLLCEDVTIQKELNMAVNTVIAMTRKSKVHQFRTDHLVFIPKRKPWKASTLLRFTQYSEQLNAHPYMLVLTVDSCQRHLQLRGANPRPSKKKKRPPGEHVFAEPASKSFKVSSRKLAPQIQTPTTKSVSSSVTSSAVSRKRMPVFDNRLTQMMRDYALTPKKDNSQTFSPEEAQRILSNIASQLRPRSARQPDTNMPFNPLHGKRKRVRNKAPQINSEEDGSTTEGSDSKTSPLRRREEASHHYELKRVAHGRTDHPNEHSDAEHVYSISQRTSGGRDPLTEKSPASVSGSSGAIDYELPKTRSRTKQSSSQMQQTQEQGIGFFSKLLTPLKRLLTK